MNMKPVNLLVIVNLIIIGSMLVSGQSSSGVQEGEPLHLWLKRSTAQDLTTLSFYEPQIEDDTDPKFRQTIGERGEDNDELVLYFPTHPDNNFLQFEYNESIEGRYNFTISAVQPLNATDTVFKLKITIYLSIERGDEPDAEVSFQIEGEADSQRRTYQDSIPIGKELVERFDEEKGGRLKIVIEREDNLDTDVLLYCGYRGGHSFLELPFSKYTHAPSEDEENGFDWTTLVIIIFGSLVIIILVFLAFGILGGKKEEEIEDLPVRRRRR
jgi:hypothetical protein